MDNDILKVIMLTYLYGTKFNTHNMCYELGYQHGIDDVKWRIAIKEELIEPFCPHEKKTYYRLTLKGECVLQTMQQVVHLSLLSNL